MLSSQTISNSQRIVSSGQMSSQMPQQVHWSAQAITGPPASKSKTPSGQAVTQAPHRVHLSKRISGKAANGWRSCSFMPILYQVLVRNTTTFVLFIAYWKKTMFQLPLPTLPGPEGSPACPPGVYNLSLQMLLTACQPHPALYRSRAQYHPGCTGGHTCPDLPGG